MYRYRIAYSYVLLPLTPSRVKHILTRKAFICRILTSDGSDYKSKGQCIFWASPMSVQTQEQPPLTEAPPNLNAQIEYDPIASEHWAEGAFGRVCRARWTPVAEYTVVNIVVSTLVF